MWGGVGFVMLYSIKKSSSAFYDILNLKSSLKSENYEKSAYVFTNHGKHVCIPHGDESISYLTRIVFLSDKIVEVPQNENYPTTMKLEINARKNKNY